MYLMMMSTTTLELQLPEKNWWWWWMGDDEWYHNYITTVYSWPNLIHNATSKPSPPLFSLFSLISGETHFVLSDKRSHWAILEDVDVSFLQMKRCLVIFQRNLSYVLLDPHKNVGLKIGLSAWMCCEWGGQNSNYQRCKWDQRRS